MNPQPNSSAARIRLLPGASDAPPPTAVPAESLVESYQLLADVFHDVLSEQSLDGLLDRIATALTPLIPHDDMHIYEVDMAKREMIPRLARSRWAAEILAERFPFGEGITGWAVEHREPVLANQAHLDPRVRFVTGTPIEPEALIVVPLIARGNIKGTLNISVTPRPWPWTTRTSAQASSIRRRPIPSPASTTTARSTSSCAKSCCARRPRTTRSRS